MVERYPMQDLTNSLEGYQWDYERLALRHSMAEVEAFLAEWRITPGARFFPRPDECAEWIESRREAGRVVRDARRQAEERRAQIAEFWALAPQWMQDTGNDEEELLKRFPSYRGTKPN